MTLLPDAGPDMTRRLASPSLLLFLAVVLAYAANGRAIGAGDTLPARYLPWSLLREWNFDLDEFPFLSGEEAREIYPVLDGVPYFLRYREGHYLSAYSPGPALVALPVYIVPVLAGASPAAGALLEKLSAAAITGFSVVVLFWALGELVSRRWALCIAAIYALGTSSLSVSGQGLWQHGPSQLFLALLLYLLVRGARDERFLAYAGFAMAAASVLRATNLMLVLPAGLWVLYTRPRLALRLILFALPPPVALVLYNLLHFGSVSGGSGPIRVPTLAFFSQTPLLEGLGGLLVSPGRGLFVYSPVLLFSLLGAVHVWRRGPAAIKAISLGPLLVLAVVSKWFLWWGGHSYGPRLLADTTPVLCFLLYPLGDHLVRRRLAQSLFVLLAAASIGAHALGAFFYDGRWDGLARVEQHPGRLWSWGESPLAFYGRAAGAAFRRLLPSTAGAPPTSTEAPGALAASFAAQPIPSEVVTGVPMAVSVTATNTGGAVWLARAPEDRGAVRLGWRWYRDGVEVPPAGREPLSFDVVPGETVRFTAWIKPPVDPGRYTLIVDLVSERVSWFADQGQQPVQAAVSVLPRDLARLLGGPPVPIESPPVLRIGTDRRSYRPGDLLWLAVELLNGDRPRSFDAYLVLRGEDGRGFLYDGRRLHPAEGPWVAWARELPLPARVMGRFAVRLPGLPAGPYVWHVVLTEPRTYRALASARAPFSVEP